MRSQNPIQQVLDAGVREGVYPGATLVAGVHGEVAFAGRAGRTSDTPPGGPVDLETIFDLGSLTKPLVTSLALMRLADQGKLALNRPLAEALAPFEADDKTAVTPRLLLCHAGGFPPWRDYYTRLEGTPREGRKPRCRAWILEEPLSYEPGRDCVYSDLGFVILEGLVEALTGLELATYVESLFFEPLGLERTFLFRRDRAPRFPREAFAATENCPWRGRVLQGEVHDENAFALGGYSGHAGLFGTAGEVFVLAGLLRDHWKGERSDLFHPETVRAFFQPQESIPGCSRTLGWDTPSPEGSAAGRHFSGRSVGHLGFPGASLWMDLERDVQVVFLTNRIHPTRENHRIQTFRPRVHDCVMEALGRL